MKMNQIFRRTLSLLLCLCMVLSMGVTAFAEGGIAAQAEGSAFQSTKTLTNGGDSDPETYTIDIDAIVNGEATEEHEGTPLDVAIIFDRSDSMSFPANEEEVQTFTTEAAMKAYLKTLDKTKPEGYYRASILSNTGARYYSDTTLGDKRYMSWEAMRYDEATGEWMVFEVCEATNVLVDGLPAEFPHGIVIQSSHVLSGYYGYWKTMSEAYKEFYIRKKANTSLQGDLHFQIAIPRLSRAQEALATFINNLNENANTLKNGQKHSVSITCFGGTVFKDGYNSDGFIFHDKVNGEEYPSQVSYPSIALAGSDATAAEAESLDYLLNTVLSNHYVYGTTHTEWATAEMSDVKYLPAKQEGRERVIILLTDGCPTGGMPFQNAVANPALASANQLKADGVRIYALSFMNGVSPAEGLVKEYSTSGTDNQKAQNFLHLYSSNYSGATSMTNFGTQVGNDCFLADDGTGADLMGHLYSILEKITTKFETPLPGEKDSVSIYDEITREFMLDADKNVKVYIQKYLGNGSFGAKQYIGEHSLTTSKDSVITASNGAYKIFWDCEIDKDDPSQPDVDLDISSIRLNWLDAKNGALREMDVPGMGCYPDYAKGYKIGLELPIVVNRDNTLGGNNIPTNTDESGLYLSTTDDTTNQPDPDNVKIEYPVPNANVEAKFETEVYDYFMDLSDYVANQNAGVTSNFAKAIFAAMLEDPAALLEYLENNKNDYVNLGISLEDLYALIANAGSDAFTANGAQSGATFDFTLDQILSALATLTYTSNEVDSIGVAPFRSVTQTLAPNYYGPKYVVVDFDETVKTPLDKESGLSPKVTGTNGAIDGTSICYNFRNNYASGNKSYLEKDYTTVKYQVTAINAPKAQKGNKIVDRNFYVIPANVMTYDDTFLTYDNNGWETIGTYTEGEQSHDNSVIHGYDPLYNGTYSATYYHNALKAVTVSKTKGVAQATFTINGTGFDIFAQTSKDSGTMAVEVSADASFSKDYKTFIVDTYLADATLNQIPVVRIDDLPYGTWYVRITAFYDAIFDHNYGTRAVITEEALRQRYGIADDADFTFIGSESGYEQSATRAINAAKKGQYNIYIDGIRVYNTINNVTANAIANYGYSQAGEGVANILNINDALVDATNANAWSGNTASGVLYTSAGAFSVQQGDTSTGIILGMEGALYTKQSGSKFYVYKDAALTVNVQYKGANVYYRTTTVTSPNGREYSGFNYYYDGGSASKPMLATQIKEAFGGEMPLYYNAKYSQYGPEKEVYLKGTNGVAFKVGTGAAKVMISLKSHNGSTATLKIYDPKSTASDKFVTLASTTSRVEMYYDITNYVTSDGYIYLKNAKGVTAVCNIKTIGTAARGITVDRGLMAWIEAIDNALPVDDSAVIKHSLNLASDISLNYAVSKATLADYDDSYLEVTFKGETFFLEPEIVGEYGYFTVDGITAVDMTEELTAKLHLFLGDEEYVSETDVYSVAQYAYAQLSKEKASEELKAVCANLLRYGALAQTFKGSSNVLADAAMTAEQKAYLTDLNTVSAVSAAKALGDVEGIAWAGKALVLDSKVAVKAIFDLTGYAGNMDALNLRVSYVNAKGEEVALTVEACELYNSEKNFYAFTVDILLATDMRSELTMALYEGDTQVSETQIYSVESYCANKTGTIGNLAKALLAYSDAAMAFFN